MKYAALILVLAGFCSGCAIYTSDGYSYGRSSAWRPPVVVHSEPSTTLPSPPPSRPPYVAAPTYAQNLPSDHIDISQVPLDTGSKKGHRPPHKGKPMQQSFQQSSDSDW